MGWSGLGIMVWLGPALKGTRYGQHMTSLSNVESRNVILRFKTLDLLQCKNATFKNCPSQQYECQPCLHAKSSCQPRFYTTGSPLVYYE